MKLMQSNWTDTIRNKFSRLRFLTCSWHERTSAAVEDQDELQCTQLQSDTPEISHVIFELIKQSSNYPEFYANTQGHLHLVGWESRRNVLMKLRWPADHFNHSCWNEIRLPTHTSHRHAPSSRDEDACLETLLAHRSSFRF